MLLDRSHHCHSWKAWCWGSEAPRFFSLSFWKFSWKQLSRAFTVLSCERYSKNHSLPTPPVQEKHDPWTYHLNYHISTLGGDLVPQQTWLLTWISRDQGHDNHTSGSWPGDPNSWSNQRHLPASPMGIRTHVGPKAVRVVTWCTMLRMSSPSVMLASSRWTGMPVGMSEMDATTCREKSTAL